MVDEAASGTSRGASSAQMGRPGVDLGLPYAVRGAGPEQFCSLCGTVTDNLDNLPLLAEAIHGAEGVRRSRVAEE